MPKKSAARSAAQRNKPRVQKSIQLVRQSVEEREPVVEQDVDTTSEVDKFPTDEERTPASAPTAVALDTVSEGTKNVVDGIPLASSGAREGSVRKKAPVQLATPDTESQEVSTVSGKGTAASRLAARRQSVQKVQQRTTANLITAEHYAYVRKDLVIIAILALIMFAVIVGLHFVPAIGG
jgi:hypothetical protein